MRLKGDGFTFARTPQIVFGAGVVRQVPRRAAAYGRLALVITGKASYVGPAWDASIAEFRDLALEWEHVRVDGEPSPELVDGVATAYADRGVCVVVAWGGGSVIDAGKAISAMLPLGGAVSEYLEDIGTKKPHPGGKAPFIAVPTTAGTGSEATKNAVLSRVGPDGFKKSLRHDNFVPDVALVDPELALTCPPEITAACGMDAFTQLLEAYVSTKASPMTDALALSGLEHVAAYLPRAFRGGKNDIEARAGMAYAALLSGIVLANAGLGVVHGLASPIGALFRAPHGAACAALVAAATEANIARLLAEQGPDHPALAKYTQVGALLSGRDTRDVASGCALLVESLYAWAYRFHLPRLGRFGITEADAPRIAAGADNKNNPASLSKDEIAGLIRRCL